MEVLKVDQKILDKYLNGKTIKTALQTPSKNVRSYVTEDDTACVIAALSQKGKVSSTLALVAAQKNWNLSIITEGNHLVCLLFP